LNSPYTELLHRVWRQRRNFVGGALYWSGAGHAYSALAKPAGAIVLMYHSVAVGDSARYIDPPNRIDQVAFEQQIAFLARRRRVMPLSSVLAEIAAGESPKAGTVCLTFDDGYLDNLTVVAPLLEKYGLPATLYLATGYVERVESQWADVLYWQIAARTRNRLSLPLAGVESADLGAWADRKNALRFLHRSLLQACYDERRAILDEIGRQLAPEGQPPRLTMNWSEVRELQHRYPRFELGGHTRDHLDLRTHRGDMAREQINGCAEDIRRELEIAPGPFSYPYSRWSPETRQMVIAGGWTSAVGEGSDIQITSSSDAYAIPRVECPSGMTELQFKTSGAFPGIFSVR
jgi:peptidoglycan/xylan/chitin deacetylase (PgdA/CDA1 family)